MHLGKWWGLVALVLACLGGTQAAAEPRVALVIGNAHYSGESLQALDNPDNDARLMAETLKKAGFDVVLVSDADQKQMKRAVRAFGEMLVSAGPEATGLFFYSGHGVGVEGESYLVPLNAEIAREADVELEAVSLGEVMAQANFAGNATNIVIVDASQNNPLSRGFRSSSGLARLGADFPGTFVSFSAAPGTLAEDGHGSNSPFVSALAETMLTPDLTISEVFEIVRRKVLEETKDRQVTWDASTLAAPFYFVPKN